MRRTVLTISSACALVGTLVYARVLTFDFAYDDRWTLVDNRWLDRPFFELAGLLASGAALTHHVPDATRPLMVLGHWVERRVFGSSAWGYHLDSLLLYALSCALATGLALLLSRKRDVALVAGCFFAVAPVHAEVVAAINYREDLLATVGVLGALLWLCSPPRASSGALSRGPASDPGPRALGIAALLGLALLGKESALSCLPILAVIVWSVPWAQASVRASRRALFAAGAVLFLWLLWRVPLAIHGDDLPLAPHRPLLQTLLRTARFEVQAVRQSLFPWSYSPDHWREPDASFGWVAPFLSLVAGVVVLGRERRTRLLALGVGLALAAPLAACPLLRPINEVADRYFFLGVLGGGLVWGWVATQAGRAFGLGRRRDWLALAVLPLALVSWRATGIWHDERTLWIAATELTPASPRAWAALSRVHRLARERDAADATMARALAVGPDYAPALVTQIYNDLAFERVEEAREHLAAIDRRGLGKEGGVGKARACAMLVAAAAAQCIER